jgi:hypothetical protein
MGTKNAPGNYDCYANAEPDEPMFVLLGRDPAAGVAVLVWCKLRESIAGPSIDGDEMDKIEEAKKCAAKMVEWAAAHGKGAKVSRAILHFVNKVL